ncbi:FAD-dependent oxidoreductase [Nocardia cyriacigeorgica]|uniref:FAD-dependent oxidoreductase n=1 Tax=Nocardia cyriacigeorgica TaxID=135487 RepID=UPI0024575F16|nr:FAD-dependent oxidoreductase [Nocardia cyriacigeorgica]
MSRPPHSAEAARDTAIRRCDVCIVGAGATGLNALFVAARYLTREQKVVLVDSRHRVGGMWVDTYPYVRLHQPHGFFTAGDIAWTLDRERSHLATKGEVLDHLAYCLDTIEQRVRVDELFGWTMVSHEETDGLVRATCVSADGRSQVIETKRLIKAYGFRITPNDPLDLSSTRVRSVSPDYCDMRGDEMREGAEPVWIVGSGKTAMDTAHTLITEYPGREVNLLAGSGTFFNDRDRFFPTGARRWWDGELVSGFLRATTRRFDGTNEAAVWEWHRATFGTWPTPETGSFLLGILSESENATIAAGTNEVLMDHLVDAVDDDGTPQLILRSGARKAIPPGSWIVNCTGYLMRHDHPYEPYVSDSGAVLSIQPRSATMHLTTMIGYFLTHLMFSDKLTEVPLYALDVPDLIGKSKTVLPYTVLALTQYNASLLYDALPSAVFGECGLDFDRWYPLPRRALAMARFALTHRRDRAHLRHVLDTVRERFDVRCGPLADDDGPAAIGIPSRRSASSDASY